METSKLRKFASSARSTLIEQVGTRLATILAEGSLARRESPKVIEELEKRIKELGSSEAGKKRLVETVAYTWFNRFCALRYMDVNRYTRIGVLSPADGQFQPEILAEAKMGHIDVELVPEATRKRVMRLLDGSDPSADPQGDAYRLLLVAVCNYYYTLMPFMFEKIADYTELLLPDDLLSGTSIPACTRELLLPNNCSPEHTDESVEVIGWLYQFYIADKKDEVFEGLKKGKKITPENIPAATQLFTPHWIVRYLVENSLGRLWMLNHPESKLVERMDYYIKPEVPETDFLKIASPEEIKVCDPACGSGHMLTYAFDLLYEIYREEQYPEPEIPALILKNNLYGIEIDQRAGALAAFALTMKAREKDKRFFTRKAQPEALARDLSSIQNPKSRIQNPNICVLENIQIDPEELSAYMDKVGRDLFSGGLQGVVTQWEEADNLGSLIRPLVTDVSEVQELLRAAAVGEDLFLAGVHQQVIKALRQADYLSPKYHVIVANPPYMGNKGMNPSLKSYLREHYPTAKSDLYTAFINCFLKNLVPGGFAGVMSPITWMFIGTYKSFRDLVLGNAHFVTLVQPEYHSFFDSAFVPICAFVLREGAAKSKDGVFINLEKHYGAHLQEVKCREAIADRNCDWRYMASTNDFLKIPNSPILYWASKAALDVFARNTSMADLISAKNGITTGDNEIFLRGWHEVALNNISFDSQSREEARGSGRRWFPNNKGGQFRKWYGNQEYVLDWFNDGQGLKDFPKSTVRNVDSFFKESVSWSDVNMKTISFRIYPKGFCFDAAVNSAFPDSRETANRLLSAMNNKFVFQMAPILNPTMHFKIGDFGALPGVLREDPEVFADVERMIEISSEDWDAFETSWGFQQNPLVSSCGQLPLSDCFSSVFANWGKMTLELQELEQKNNRLYINAYGLGNELTPDIPLEEITLTRNSKYRYNESKSETELEALLLADTIREFISYAVGCMLGRYSLDKPGLILANQGETADDYRRQIPEPTFAPDEDNVVPLLDGDWFTDDTSERFKAFLKVTFGTEHYEENLTFLENALYPDNLTGKKRKTIRDYFLKDFYNHHIKLYKKRPIYWLFSSPKGTFNALIYMHRYRPGTVGTVLQYLRDFRDKLAHHAEHRQMTADSASASKTEKTQAIKEVGVIKKQLKELEDYEKTLFEVAARKIDIDLDDGVKHNYLLFGSVLRKIPGLDAKED
jgi:type II restriction/modification system DNA methylase subunit YeeA